MRIRFGHFVLFVVVMCLAVSSCSTGPSTEKIGQRGVLRFQCNVPNASLSIDETHVGPIGMFVKSGVLLRPGTHRIVVHKVGYFKVYKLIEVAKDQVQLIPIEMVPIPE